MTKPLDLQLFEDVFVLLGEVPTERIVHKIHAVCPAKFLIELRDAMRIAVEHFAPSAGDRAAALRQVIKALEAAGDELTE